MKVNALTARNADEQNSLCETPKIINWDIYQPRAIPRNLRLYG